MPLQPTHRKTRLHSRTNHSHSSARGMVKNSLDLLPRHFSRIHFLLRRQQVMAVRPLVLVHPIIGSVILRHLLRTIMSLRGRSLTARHWLRMFGLTAIRMGFKTMPAVRATRILTAL